MINYCFQNFSPIILERYKQFIVDNIGDISKDLSSAYIDYACLDKNFPRPILTVLGANYGCNKPNLDMAYKFSDIMFIPQLVRDFLAIHDDIIDEDLIKFNQKTLPYSYSAIQNESTGLTKNGKDIALLFADYILPLIYKVASNCIYGDAIRLKIVRLINQVLSDTNYGQITELYLQNVALELISEEEILALYRKKAADYCYAFPFIIGLTVATAPLDLINNTREVLLKIGTYSQIVNDIEGVFSESFDNERDTMSDLVNLRRTYLLVKFAHVCKEQNVLQLLCKNTITIEECIALKETMYKYNILHLVKADVETGCELMKKQFKTMQLGNMCKEYFCDLINGRVLSNLAKVINNGH